MRLVGIIVFAILFGSGPALASELFLYRAPDGTRWITDHRPPGAGFRLLKRYGYQRTAKACSGLSRRALARRAADYDSHISSLADATRIEKSLILAIIHVESCFDEQAVSRAGARGLMQLMPGTAARYGVRDIHDPEQNIRGGVSYLKDLFAMFDNNRRLVLAAYNAGENAVKKYDGIPPYKETQTYVKRVLHYYDRYRTALN